MTILKSPLGRIDLEPENAIRDFITDLMLKSEEVFINMKCLVDVISCEIERLEPGAEGRSRLEFVQDNLREIFSGQLPRRKNATLLHEAARDGAERLFVVCLDAQRRMQV